MSDAVSRADAGPFQGVGVDPDDPLLARAQQALKKQLTETKRRVDDELREKTKLLSDAEKRKENLGVNLFNFQQQLAQLQAELEKCHKTHTGVASLAGNVSRKVQEVKGEHDVEAQHLQVDRVQADKFQEELDRQANTLHQIEAYHTAMKQEIAVTRRATYKAEETIQNLEKEKSHQDTLIEKLQETLKSLHQQAALLTAQIDGQKQEVRSATETLVEAEKEKEAVLQEKRQLISQWNACLLAITNREKTLSGVKATIDEQIEQDRSITNEIQRFKKETLEQQVQHERLSNTIDKLEGEISGTKRSIDTVREKGERTQEMLHKLEKAQTSMEERLRQCGMARQAINNEISTTDKLFTRINAEKMAVEEKMVAVLSEQMTVEKGSAGAASQIQKRQKEEYERLQMHSKELRVVMIQNEVAKLSVDVLNTEAHNVQLQDTLKLLDEELSEKAKVIDKYEMEIQRRNDEIEKKTRNVDTLNRKLQKLVLEMEGEDTGPLEATINNLNRELQRKDVESKDLQRHWINLQTELVSKEMENNSLSEEQARLTSQFSILAQKKAGLQTLLESEQKEIHVLERNMSQANKDLARINAQISEKTQQAAQLEEKHFQLQQAVTSELKDEQDNAKRVEASIQDGNCKKKELLSDILETERQIMLWERKLQLDTEMRELLDPSVGQDVIGAMKKEIHRMQLRKSDLERVKEQLMKELERSVEKRDNIATKGRARIAQASKTGGKLTEKQLEQKSKELQSSIGETEAECAATESRTQGLESQRALLAEKMQEIAAECSILRARDAEARQNLSRLFRDKMEKTLHAEVLAHATNLVQSGKFKHDDTMLSQKESIHKDREQLLSLLERLSAQNADFALEAETIKLHDRASILNTDSLNIAVTDA